MTDNDMDNVEARYVSISSLMKMYSMSRATAIRWVKDNEEIRYIQDGRFLRVNLSDFEEFVDKMAKTSRENQDKIDSEME